MRWACNGRFGWKWNDGGTNFNISYCRNVWDRYVPKTNVFWLRYLLDKMMKEVRYRRSDTKIHQSNLELIENFYASIVNFDSSYQLCCNAFFRWIPVKFFLFVDYFIVVFSMLYWNMISILRNCDVKIYVFKNFINRFFKIFICVFLSVFLWPNNRFYLVLFGNEFGMWNVLAKNFSEYGSFSSHI